MTALANVEQAAEIRRPELVGQLLDQVAARSAGEIVVTDLSRELQASAGLVESYLDVLETPLPRSPPPWLDDEPDEPIQAATQWPTSSIPHSLHISSTRTATTSHKPTAHGSAHSSNRSLSANWPNTQPGPTGRCYRAVPRSGDQREVDVVVERGRQVAGIEVKATATPRPRDARHLAYLRDRLGDRFTLGVVLHTGYQRVVLGDRLVAAVSTLWG